MLRSVSRLAPAGVRFMGAPGPKPLKLDLPALQANKANLEKLIKELKAKADVKADATAPELVASSWDDTSGQERIMPLFIKTPWDSDGMDGGSANSLLLRYERDLKELEAMEAALK